MAIFTTLPMIQSAKPYKGLQLFHNFPHPVKTSYYASEHVL